MALLDDGEDARAATAFSTFIAKHPSDPRAEDAAYLRVIALQRAGSAVDMKEAAEDYLRRYPAGFRRSEVERLAR
jgi:outer membrane protein assembly factor BamD (BamD/ComL family)